MKKILRYSFSISAAILIGVGFSSFLTENIINVSVSFQKITYSKTKSAKTYFSDFPNKNNAASKKLVAGGAYIFKNPYVNPNKDTNTRAFLLADVETDEIIASKKPTKILPIASVTKLMTALISLENINQFQETIISKTAEETEGRAGGLKKNELITTGLLLYPLLLESSNDAAEALAEHLGRANFINLMNKKSGSLGMKSTYFDDPSGLSDKNVSTAEDLFILLKHIWKTNKSILNITMDDKHNVENLLTVNTHSWRNRNYVLKNKERGYIGGKTGFTNTARHTLAALFKLRLGSARERTIALIMLGSDNGERDYKAILSFMKKNVVYSDRPKNTVSSAAAGLSLP